MKQTNRALIATAIAAFTVLAGVAVAAALPDGATIVNSGSTNTAGYVIKIRSDGQGSVAVENESERTFTIDPALAEKFLDDAEAAREDPGPMQHCMKSVSFGTTTTVRWHGYISHDLQCPPYSKAVAMLAHDVQAIQQAAGVGVPTHRIRLPIDHRMIPPSASPSMSPTP